MTGLRVGVVGVGYVGLTTAVCVADRGTDTVALDVDQAKVEMLTAGTSPIDEPGLDDLLRAGLAAGRLRFTPEWDDLSDRDLVFVCVPTPSDATGAADLRAVDSVVARLAEVLNRGAVVAMKSTVPVGTSERVSALLNDHGIGVVSTPEFLREGHAVHDFRHPDRVVVGASADRDVDPVLAAYGIDPDRDGDVPVLRMSPESAEVAKYASNAFLAIKLSYANSLARLCASVGADVGDVTACMGADERIGAAFLNPGPGWGGSCLPKDTLALLHTAQEAGVPMTEVEASRRTNADQAERIADALRRSTGRTLDGLRIAAFGLTFKAGTSDTRDSPALSVCDHLARHGAQVQGFDPALPSIDPEVLRAAGVTGVDDPYRAAKAADAILVLTEWPQIAELDWPVIAEGAPDAVVIDTRNLLSASVIDRSGLPCVGNGTPAGY